MTMSLARTLESLAMAQAMLVVPALGDSYEGKTAGTLAGLLLMLAQNLEAETAHRERGLAFLEALLASASASDPAIAQEIEPAHAEPGESGAARESRLLGALTNLHRWADANDADLARRCRDWLVLWTEGLRLRPPAPPG
jgi:hypothetical protein